MFAFRDILPDLLQDRLEFFGRPDDSAVYELDLWCESGAQVFHDALIGCDVAYGFRGLGMFPNQIDLSGVWLEEICEIG